MGIPVSLSAAAVALLIGIAVVLMLIAAFVAVFLSLMIGLAMAQLLYVGGSWCVRRIRESYSSSGKRSEVGGRISGTAVAAIRSSKIRKRAA